jgi:hypothetical protein
LETILNEIDKSLQSTFKSKGLKAYGLCELVTKDDKPNPVTVANKINKSREVAQIHDRFNGIFYHRVLPNVGLSEDEEFSFGSRLKIKKSPKIRTVVVTSVKLGEDFIYQFAAAIPDKLTLTGYKFIFIKQGTLIDNHEAVYNEEYGQNSYDKHRINWNVYALEYDIEFMLC